MNLSSLYKSRFTEGDLSKYTTAVVDLIILRLTDKISKEELADKLKKIMDKFTIKYGR